jgi:predicted N-acetyltransferase YhbS
MAPETAPEKSLGRRPRENATPRKNGVAATGGKVKPVWLSIGYKTAKPLSRNPALFLPAGPCTGAAMSELRENLSWLVRQEAAGDAARIEALNAAAFGPGRFAKSAYRLREGVAPVPGLSFVAVENPKGRGEVLRGSVRFWPIRAGSAEALLLGPLAVETAQRGRGIGIGLMQAGIEAAHRGPWSAILLVGDEPYYAKVGFARLPPGRVTFPGPVDPKRVLGLSLKPGGLLNLSGQVRRAQIDDPVCADGAGLG